MEAFALVRRAPDARRKWRRRSAEDQTLLTLSAPGPKDERLVRQAVADDSRSAACCGALLRGLNVSRR